MVHDHHESEDLAHLLDFVLSHGVFEQGDEHVLEPVVVDSLLLHVDLEDFEDAWVLEFPESSLHQFEQFALHLHAECRLRVFVVSQEYVLELAGKQIIDMLFDLIVEFLPELLVLTVEFLHQMIIEHELFGLNDLKILI
jgi:hypothetical protein